MKDSFVDVDPAPFGIEVLCDARWIAGDATDALASLRRRRRHPIR